MQVLKDLQELAFKLEKNHKEEIVMLSKAVIENSKHVWEVQFENGESTLYYTNEDRTGAIEDMEAVNNQRIISIKDIKEELK